RALRPATSPGGAARALPALPGRDRAPDRRDRRPRLLSAQVLRRAGLLLALVVCLAAGAAAADEPAIPEPVGFVNDHAGLLDDTTRARLEAFLDQVKQKTGAEFAVLTMQSTAPLDPADYKVKVFEQWKLGKGGEDTGLLLLVAMEERQTWFETGYGLEGILP